MIFEQHPDNLEDIKTSEDNCKSLPNKRELGI